MNTIENSNVQVINSDCRTWMQSQEPASVSCVVTSPPYNLGIGYSRHNDAQPLSSYLGWLGSVFSDIHRILRDDGHLFLNVGCTNKEPWRDFEVAQVARLLFHLQNRITWVKSISIGVETKGHFKPVSSRRFITPTNESIFHLTKTGSAAVDRDSIGVPYADKTNLDKTSRIRGKLAKTHGFANWRDFHNNATAAQRASLEEQLKARVAARGPVSDRHCLGNTWFIPYDTIRDRCLDRGSHPATFPVALPEKCIRFAGCKPGSVVYDPFMGTGTTLVAAQSLGMKACGTDVDEAYVAYATRRLATAVGAQAS